MANKHTTLRLNPSLMRRVKAYARKHDLTLTAVMERALATYLARPPRDKAAAPVRFQTFSTGGTLDGVDLDSNARLLDVMDGVG